MNYETYLANYVNRDTIKDHRVIEDGSKIVDYIEYSDGVIRVEVEYGYYEGEVYPKARIEFTRPTTDKEKADYDRYSEKLKQQKERERKARERTEQQKEAQERQLLAKLKKKYEGK